MAPSPIEVNDPHIDGRIEGGGAVDYDPETEAETEHMKHIHAIKDAHEDELMAIPGVQGVGIGQNGIGEDVVLVYLKDAAAKQHVPPQLEDVPVETTIVGEIDAY